MTEPPAKRFKYASYNAKLKEISVGKGKGKAIGWGDAEFEEDEGHATPFTSELARLGLHDLTLPYQKLSKDLYPLTPTLPITLLNLQPISEILSAFFANLKDGQDHLNSGLDSALSLVQALFATCLGEAASFLPSTAKDLLRTGKLRALEPRLIEKSFSTLSEVLRQVAATILKPDADLLLRQTWAEITPYLRPKDNKRYVRRCVADAWVAIIRKARGDGLKRLIGIMLEEDHRGMEAVWAHSVKGGPKQLHSRAMPILDTLLDDLRDYPTTGKDETMSLVITSICHHCSSATLGPIIQNLLDRLDQPLLSPQISQLRIFPLLSTLLFIRKGKRYPENLLKPTMQKLLGMALTAGKDDAWVKQYLRVVIAVLMASKLEQWLSPGVMLIEKIWRSLDNREAFEFATALVILKWPGVEQFLLPHIARSTTEGLSSNPLATILLLNTLRSHGYLASGLSNVQGGRWRTTMTTNISTLLEKMSLAASSIDDRRLLGEVLQLVPALGDLATFEPHLSTILKHSLQSRLSHAEWIGAGVWNDGHMLAAVLRCVNEISHTPVGERLREMTFAEQTLAQLVDAWVWNREVMEQLAVLVENFHDHVLDAGRLECNLFSADSVLRRSSLRMLAAASGPATSSDAPTPADIWASCLQIENADMSLRNSREKPTEIARLGRLLLAISSVEMQQTFYLALRYLLVQLKVNYRPVYPETIKWFTQLAPSRGDAIWDLVWQELQRTHSSSALSIPDFDIVVPDWARSNISGPEVRTAQDVEDEAEFRCPNLERQNVAVSKALAGISVDDEVSNQISHDRLDVLNYEAQLLAVLGSIVSLAEKHTRILIPMFFEVAGHDDGDEQSLSTRQRQQRTANFLELLAKFVNPKAAFRSDELRQVYLNILAKGDNNLQKLALDCLLTYKSPSLVLYQANLKALLEESKFRDELVHFQLGQDMGIIDPQHRAEAIPVTIRLLYGIITARRGRTSAHGLAGRKQAVLTSMSGCSSDELGTLVDLMLEPFDQLSADSERHAVGRQQLGFLSLLQDVLRYLGPQMEEHWPRLLKTTIELVGHAQAVIGKEAEVVEEDEEEEELENGSAPLRNIRSVGIKRIVQFLRSRVDFDFDDYLPGIFSAAISPRLDKLEIENTQAPSGTLEIIAAIAAVSQTAASLNTLDARTLPKTFACLVAVKVKPAVIARVFDVIESLLSPIHDDPPASPTVLLPNMRALLESIIQLVPNLKTGNDDLMRRLLGILSSLSTIVTDGQQAQQLATLLSPLLRQPSKQLSEKAKLNILLTLQRLFAISPDFADPQSTFFTQNYEQICNLLQILFFPNSRRALISLLDVFAEVDGSIRDAIRVVGEINAYSARRLEEPDFDRRLAAFAEINELPLDQLYTTRRQWLPLIRASLFFIRDPDELSIRTSASSVIQRFLLVVGDSTEGELVDTFLYVVLPSLKQTLRSKLELVRNEALIVLSFAVKTCTVMADLLPLLGGGDEEVNFFTNMTHIQVHRRTRAIHRLRDLCDEGLISETAVSTIFVPLLEHNITGATDVTDHHLTNEAILAIGTLSGILRWSRYSATIMRYLRLGSGKSAQQKFYIRTVSSIIDNFKFDLKSEVVVDVREEVDEEKEEAAPVESGPNRAAITQVVLTRLLPALSRFVEHKDETEDNIRIPVALGIVKIASALPGDSSGNEVLRIITTASQILRSKDQDTRDLARETICKIAIYLGPDWLVRVLKELRDALQRGPQKHVLAVTTHAILVQATSDAEDRFSDLDAAVQDAVEVSAEVVWGESGRDVESDGFKTKMREVKGAMTRGYDTFQLVSRLASPAKVSTILAPLRDVMHASQSVKTMLQVDEALRRIALGLNANAQLGAKDLLNLCHSLVSGNSVYLQSKKKAKTTRGDRFSVQMKRDDKKVEDYYPLNAPKFVAFGLDLFVTAFRRGKFDFEDVDILARLGPLVGAIGNTLYSTHTNVPLLGLKATAAIARCPLPQLEAALPVYLTNIFRILKLAGGTAESDLAQTALKTLAVLLRDCKSATISDSQLKYLLEVISPDVEEADRQGAIFAVLRSIVGRNFVVPEVYDLMDRVSSIMVTSQSANVQEQCRSVLIQFLLDYPQGSGRLKNQMTFLAQNLDYVYQSGRISVMELLSAVFSKFSDDIIQEYADLFFVALVMVLANDDSEKCRTMAGALVKQLVERVDARHRVRIVGILKSWVERRKEHTALGGAALSVFGLLTGSKEVGLEVVDTALEIVTPIMAECAAALASAEDDGDEVQPDHQLPHQALVTLAKILRVNDSVSPDLPWAEIIDMLLFPHDWVRFDAARVIITVLTKTNGFDLLDNDQLLDIARKGCLLLKGGKDADGEETVVDAKLADEVIKLLWNVAKHWANTQTANAIDEDDNDKTDGKQPLSWLMSRTSFLARRLIIDRPSSHIAYLQTEWTRPVTSIFRFFAGVYDVLSEQQAKQFSRHVLAPVYRILDDGGDLANMEDNEAIDNLRTLATEVRDFVQNKIGPSDFSQVWESLRKKVRETREGRREEKNRMAVADPQAWADRKGKRGEMKKESKKRKVKAFADAKQRERPVKRRAPA